MPTSLGGDFMIPFYWNKNLTRLAGTDLDLQLHGEINFHPDKAEQVST